MFFPLQLKQISIWLIIGIGLLTTINASAKSTDAATRLQQLLSNYQKFSSQFEQQVISEDGRKIQQTKGELLLEKPNRFRWTTKQPFPQEIISDGKYLWIYDPDLEQVTQRLADNQQNSAPARLLNGQISSLKNNFSIKLLKDDPSGQIFKLKPLKEQQDFVVVHLFFVARMISELKLEDNLGQHTSIIFFKQELNPNIDPKEFQFTPPKGTDVIIDIDRIEN